MGKINNKNIFLIDGTGALLSALSLGLILPLFCDWIGLPVMVLYLLAAAALGLCLGSFGFYWLIDHNKPNYLRAIILSNLTYCVVTLLLIGRFWDHIRLLGIAYFTLEITIILGLVYLEWTIWRKLRKASA